MSSFNSIQKQNFETINTNTQSPEYKLSKVNLNQNEKIEFVQLPKHIAIIPDGNRRWAKIHGVSTLEAHEIGQVNIRHVLEELLEKTNIPVITIWLLSTENLERPQKEINALFKAIKNFVSELLPAAHREKCKLHRIGSPGNLPEDLLHLMDQVEQETQMYSRCFNIAINYGGRWDILNAINNWIINNPEKTEVSENEINQYVEILKDNFPGPDLIIRSGSDSLCKRTSGFFPWQTIYSQFYFTETMLPDLKFDEVKLAIEEFSKTKLRLKEYVNIP